MKPRIIKPGCLAPFIVIIGLSILAGCSTLQDWREVKNRIKAEYPQINEHSKD
jgi:hypothetical protein